jgi:hypothetical protein
MLNNVATLNGKGHIMLVGDSIGRQEIYKWQATQKMGIHLGQLKARTYGISRDANNEITHFGEGICAMLRI